MAKKTFEVLELAPKQPDGESFAMRFDGTFECAEAIAEKFAALCNVAWSFSNAVLEIDSNEVSIGDYVAYLDLDGYGGEVEIASEVALKRNYNISVRK